MSNEMNNGCLDWDAVIEDDGQRNNNILLEEGDYDFVVTGIEKARHNGSGKIPACNKAIVSMTVATAEGVAQLKMNLYLFKTVEWKLSSFFRSIEQKKFGEKLKMDWDHVEGKTGRAHIIQRKYTGNDGNEYKTNDIDYFIDPTPDEKNVSTLVHEEDDIPF